MEKPFIIFIAVAIVALLFMISLFFDDLVGNCSAYSAAIKNGLDDLNSQHPCVSDEDCMVGTYYPCKPYGISKDIKNLTGFYDNLGFTRPSGCPYVSCAPVGSYKTICENGLCGIEKIA